MARSDSTEDGHLVTTFVAARALGVSARTLQRWAAAGRVTPATTQPGGQHWWRTEDLPVAAARGASRAFDDHSRSA